MEIQTRQKNEPISKAENIKPGFNDNIFLSKILDDQVFIRQVASVPTEPAGSWSESIRIKDDGSELYVWDGGAWRTFSSPLGVSGTIDTTASQTVTVVNGIITNIA